MHKQRPWKVVNCSLHASPVLCQLSTKTIISLDAESLCTVTSTTNKLKYRFSFYLRHQSVLTHPPPVQTVPSASGPQYMYLRPHIPSPRSPHTSPQWTPELTATRNSKNTHRKRDSPLRHGINGFGASNPKALHDPPMLRRAKL